MAHLRYDMNGETRKLSLYAAQNVPALGMFDRVSAAIKYLVFGAPVILVSDKVKVKNARPVYYIWGGEGSGKTTQIQRLKDWIEKNYTELSLCLVRVSPVALNAEVIRALLLNGVTHENGSPLTEAMLISAARHEHVVHVIQQPCGKVIL